MAVRLLGSFIGVIVASFSLALLYPFGDPGRHLQQPPEMLLQTLPLPDAARRILSAKCADCHSNTTRWPIYSWAAPVSWLIERDVVEGRERLDLSHWNELGADRQQVLEQEIVEQTKKGAMPPLSYRLIHWKANLEPYDHVTLAALVRTGTVGATPTQAGDADRGRALFNRRCAGCHGLDSDREGPRLRGVYERRAGSVPGFKYSSAIRNSGITWTTANLDKWLRDSDSMLPGNDMGLPVPKPQDRSDLIAFLKSLQ
jgi:cytochrome c